MLVGNGTKRWFTLPLLLLCTNKSIGDCRLCLCAGNSVYLFIAIALVRCHSVQCALFGWTVIERVTLNGQVQNSVWSEIDSIYRLTALRDGRNELVIHTKPIAAEHMQVPSFH